MVFAALLGSTFITITASNLNHTARQGELASARQATQAGISFINDRLTNSPQGERWRPWKVLGNPPPKPGGSDFNLYYTSLERANGWINEVDFSSPNNTNDLNLNGINYGQALNDKNVPEQEDERFLNIEAQLAGSAGTTPKRCFVKFPDPRGPATNAGGPQYLAEVKPDVVLGTSKPTGLLKITVIGLSEDNPNASEVRTAFKRGLTQNPLFTSARTISNWDFVNHVVPEAQVASLAGLDLNISNRRGNFPPAPFYITIGGLSSPLQTALVTQLNSLTQLRLSAPITPVEGDRVQVAAALGAPSGVDYDADGVVLGSAADASGRKVLYNREAVAWSAAETPAASHLHARVNGGLIWMGNALLKNNAQAQASGLMALRDVPGSAQALPRAVGFNGYNARLIDSRDPNFPIFQGQDEDGSPINREAALSSIRDGMDRLRGIPNSQRAVEDMVPPSIESNRDASRYREMSKYCAPNLNITGYGPNPEGGSGALFGYGEGVYIDNARDVEQLTTPGSTATRAMTSAQLRQMLFGSAASTSASLSASFQRNVKPYGIGQKASVGGAQLIPTLEQKHLRGWIGPDEFRARGALVELAPAERYFGPGNPNDDRTIYVTLDALSDGGPVGDGTDANGPDPAKSFRLADGSLTPGSTRYKRRLPWPQNGVIFVEGNIRLKGGAFDANGRTDAGVDPHRGLTIVTMNNAYIEGSLNAGARKIAILARQNVILNPTAVMSRLEAQTTVRSRGSTLNVDDAALFEPGDWVEINNSDPFRVLSVPSPTSITLSRAYNSNPPNPPLLRAIQDPLFDSAQAAFPYYGNAVRIGKASDIVQRRFMLPRGASSVRLSLRHSAFRRDAFALQADRLPSPLAPSTIDLSSKMILGVNPQSSVIPASDKYLRVNYGGVTPSPGSPDVFSNVTPASAAELATSNTFRLGVTGVTQGLEKQIEDRNASHAPEMWSYNTTNTRPLGSYDFSSAASPSRSPLWFFLAASSNRHTFGYAPGEPLQRKQSLLATTPATLPLGTSITAFLNTSATPSALTNDRFNPSTRAFDERVNQFGFNPQLDGAEDSLTADSTFYTGYVGAGAAPSTPAPSTNVEQIALDFDSTDYALDSRSLAIASPSASGQNLLALTLNNRSVKLNAASDTGLSIDDFFQKSRAKIPYYRLSRLKLDTPDAPSPAFDASGQLAKIAPGATIEVQAFVYAQQGSWMIIPGDFYDRALQTDASGSFITRPNGTRASMDLNRDGVVTRDERSSVYRLRRYNYKILFRGSIMENQAMPVVSESAAAEPGSVSDWMDKWAAFRFTSANGDFDDAQRDGIANSTASARRSQAEIPLSDANPNANFGNISYEFDSTIAGNAAFMDTGFRPPMPPDLLYQD